MRMNNEPIIVIGAGLAGSEAAWQLAHRGIRMRLYEMRPAAATEAHRTTLAGLERPWSNLAPYLTGMVVEAGYGGGTHLAYGTRK